MIKIRSNIRQIIETIILLVGTRLISAYLIRELDLFREYFLKNINSIDQLLLLFIMDSGDNAIIIGTFLIILYFIVRYNRDYIMNQNNFYHNYPYCWYWYCRNILGIKRCNLVLVPIYMQFKLVINHLFDAYPLSDDDYPESEDEEECKVTKFNFTNDNREINLILEDTYLIQEFQIPPNKQQLPTIKISRNNGDNMERRFSQRFINAVITEVKNIPNIARINIYATTNPKNTLNIAQRVFKNANRGNIEHLYVYQQENTGNRNFKSDEHKIY